MTRERVIPVIVTGQHSGMAEADKPPSERSRNMNAFADSQFFEPRTRQYFMNMDPTPYETTFGVSIEPENEYRAKETPIRVHVVNSSKEPNAQPPSTQASNVDNAAQTNVERNASKRTNGTQDSANNNDGATIEHRNPIEREPCTQLQAPSSYNHHRDASPGKVQLARASFDRKASIDEMNDKILGILDEIESRIELIRDQAAKIEAEKESLNEMLDTLQKNTDILRLGDGDREDVEATMDRLVKRLKTVEVNVNIPRNEQQVKALDTVTEQIDALVKVLMQEPQKSKETLQRWLNACSPDAVSGAIDQRFQSTIIGCTVEDQKRIRRRLQQLLTQVESAEN